MSEKLQDNEIDLAELVKILWKRKIFIVLGVFVITLFSTVTAFMLPKIYISKGFYVLSHEQPQHEQSQLLSIPQYKRYSSIFLDRTCFIEYLVLNKPLPEEKLSGIVRNLKNSRENLSKYFYPEYAFTKEDTKKLAEIKEGVSNYVIGTKIEFKNNEPKTAQSLVYILGDFLKISIIYEKLKDFVSSGYSSSKNNIKKCENTHMENEFEMKQALLKMERLNEINRKYPEAKGIINRQVLSVEKGGDRYLSPITQLVGIESYISNLKSRIDYNKKALEISLYRFDFFKKAKKLLETKEKSESLLKSLIDLSKSIFSNEELKNDNAKIAYNELSNSFENYSNLFNTVFSFAPEPNFPEMRISPRRKSIVIISFFISVFIFIFIAFILEWWLSNKNNILKKKSQS